MFLAYKPLFDQYCAKGLSPFSSYHFSAVFAWKDYFQFKFEEIDKRLCIFAYQGKESFLYLPPLGGDIELPTVKECFKRMGRTRLARIENISENQLNIFDKGQYNAYLKAHEYVYQRKDLESLSGDKYKSKRHDVNLFQERFPQAVYRPYRASDLKDCQHLYVKWAKNRGATGGDDVYMAMLEENKQVHASLIEHMTQLWLVGRVVEIDGRIAGYSFGYPLNPETFCVLLEITDLEKKGLAAYIFNRFCCDDYVKGFDYINTMDDFGVPNVARVKESYHPVKKLPVYTITEKDTHQRGQQ